MTKTISKIKENISKEDYVYLMKTIERDSCIRNTRKIRLTYIFALLYNLGLRVNEVTQLTNKMINDLIKNKSLIITTKKTKSERKLFINESSRKELQEIFKNLDNTDTYIIKSERGTMLHNRSIIQDVNSYLKKVFGDDTRITSHSFRQSLITELAVKNVNTKIIQEYIGHKNISTTLRYVKPSEENIIDSLEMLDR